MDELYYIKHLTPDCIQVAKEIDGEIVTGSVYRVVGSNCQCWQAIRKKDCRHLAMIRKVQELGGLKEPNEVWTVAFNKKFPAKSTYSQSRR